MPKSAENDPKMRPGSELDQLVDRIQHLKQEHAPLVTKISGDHGMSAELRTELLQHLNEEEAEIIAKMAAIAPQVAARYRPSAAGPNVGAPSGAGAGARAPERQGRPAPERESRLTVGSLRADAPAVAAVPPNRAANQPSTPTGSSASRRAGLPIGSLRSR